MTELQTMGKKAKAAAIDLAKRTPKQKTQALLEIAAALRSREADLLAANALDRQAAAADGMSPAMLDRLTLNHERIEDIAKGIEEIAAMKDPVGSVVEGGVLPNGLKVQQIRVPLGVVGIIYEARPNVTADAAALCLKSSNAVILRGGKESFHSTRAIAFTMREAAEQAGMPADCIQFVQDTSRESSKEMMGLVGYLDVLIPRGGAGLIRCVVQNSRVPVIQTGEGNCHIYVDEFADIDMAASILFNAKTSRPSVCNAAETALVHSKIAAKALPRIREQLDKKQVELRGCPRTMEILPGITPATEEDWATEYLDYILAVKVVDSLEEAMAHIAKYSTGHSEAIITENYRRASQFIDEVDSAAVYVNASTRFTDGSQLGLGAEIGISTQKLHARGPMGVEKLTSTKFIICGNGQIR